MIKIQLGGAFLLNVPLLIEGSRTLFGRRAFARPKNCLKKQKKEMKKEKKEERKKERKGDTCTVVCFRQKATFTFHIFCHKCCVVRYFPVLLGRPSCVARYFCLLSGTVNRP